MSDSLWPHGLKLPGSSSMGFSRQEDWSGLPFPSPGDLPNTRIELRSPALQTDSFLSEPPRNDMEEGIVVPFWDKRHSSGKLRIGICSVWDGCETQSCEMYGWQTVSKAPEASGLAMWECVCVCVCVCVHAHAQLCLTLCDPMDYSRPGSSVHGILQAIRLEWVVVSFSRELGDFSTKTMSKG